MGLNKNQRIIITISIAVIVLMGLFPPWTYTFKSTMTYSEEPAGYSFIASAPERRQALKTHGVKLDILRLLVQWVVVFAALSAGVLITARRKDEQDQPALSPQQSTVVTPPIEKPIEQSEGLYEAILGEKNRTYYLAKFKEFDQQGPGLKASWNWAAFFGGGIWLLYRKMYGWFFAFWGFGTISSVILKAAGSFGLLAIVLIADIAFWITFTIYANSLYHRKIKKKIAVAQLTLKDEPKLLELLRYKGGVHTWVIWVFTLVPVAGILAAIAIPNFIAYKERSQNTAAESKPAESVPAQVIHEKTGTALKERKMQSLSDWNKIQQDPEYWKYSAEDRALIKSGWFKKNIVPSPEFQKYSPEDQGYVLKGFMQEEEPKSAYKKEKRGGNAAVKGVASNRSVNKTPASPPKPTPVAESKAEEIAKIDLQYPGWRDTVKSEAFGKWIAIQSEDIKKKCASYKAEDAIAVLKAFNSQ